MRKWIIAGVVLLSLIVVVFLALLNLNSLINRNKDYLLDQAQQALGRKVSVGEIGLTLWGGVGFQAKNFALADDPSFSSGNFVRARDLQVNVKLLPLLQKELQVKRLILHDPAIEIIRDKKGEFNFSTIGKPGKEKARGREPQKEGREPPKKEEPLPLLVSLVDIAGGDVHYRDQKEGTDLRVKQIDLQVKDLDFNKPFAVDLAAALFSEKQNLKVEARVGPLGRESDFNKVPLEAALNVDPIDMGQLKTAMPRIKTSLPKDLDLSGIFSIKDAQLKGSLNQLTIKGSLEGTSGSISFGKIFQKASGTPLVLSADARYADNRVSFRQVKVKLHTLELGGKGDVKLGDPPVVDLALDSNQFSFEGWEKILPLIENYQLAGKLEIHTTLKGRVGKGAAPQVQGTLTFAGVSAKPPQFPKAVEDLNAKVNFSGQRADLKETTLSLGKSRIRLAAEIDRFAPLALSYKISTPEIWPADFQASLPQERKADVIKNLSSEGKLVNQNGDLTFQGKLSSTGGTLYKIGYKDLGATLSLANQVAKIRSLRVNALNGSLQTEGEYAFNKPVPRFSLVSKIQGIDLKELYSALDPKGQRDIQGRLNADMKVFGSGKTWEEMKPNLGGQGEAEVLQGALLNFNIAEGVLSGITGIPGLTSLMSPQVRQKYPETFEAKDTEFKEMKGLFSLGDSRINLKSLRISAADYTVQGNGWADFDRKVNFRSLLVFSQRLSADLGRSAREVRYLFNDRNEFEIPFALTGTLPKVRPKPDSSYLAKMIQRGMVRKGTEELQRRFFGSKKSTQESAPPSQKDTEPGSKEDLIRKGLDTLFGR